MTRSTVIAVFGICLLVTTPFHASGVDVSAAWFIPWITPILKAAGAGIIGSAASGIGRRIESQLAGGKARQDYAGQGPTPTVINTHGAAQYGTQQAASQGQAVQAQADMQYNQLMHDSRQRALDRQHELQLQTNQLSFDGQHDNGQSFLNDPLGMYKPSPQVDALMRQSNDRLTKATRNYVNSPEILAN